MVVVVVVVVVVIVLVVVVAVVVLVVLVVFFQVLSHLGVALGMHYLSFLDLLLMPRSHKPAGKPTENPELLNPKLSLVIHGAFSFSRPSGKPESSVNYKE